MFEISSKERRITNYVKEQACEWLFERIKNEEYTAPKNEKLLLSIKKEGRVRKETYEEFFDKFCNDPYVYLTHKKYKKYGKICTDKIDNYFIKYNDEMLPFGFVKEFFEDDYETSEERKEFNQDMLSTTKEHSIISAREKYADNVDCMDKFKETFKKWLSPKFEYHLSNIMKIILPIFAFVLCLNGIADFAISRLDIGLEIEAIRDYAAELRSIDRSLEMSVLYLLISIVGVLWTVVPFVKAIGLIIFYIKWIAMKVSVFFAGLKLTIFEKAIKCMEEYFNNLTKEHILINGNVTDKVGVKKNLICECIYNSIFTFNMDKNKEKNNKLYAKYEKKINFYSESKKWFSAVFFILIWCILGVMINTALGDDLFSNFISVFDIESLIP